MTTSPIVQSPVEPGWRRACGGIWRLTWPRFFSLRPLVTTAALLALVVLLCMISVGFGESRRFIEWNTWFYLLVLVPVVAFLFGARAVRDDMDSVSVDYLLTRPISPPLYLACRYICHLVCMQLVFLAACAALGGVGAMRGVEGLFHILMYLFPAQVMLLAVFTALGFFAGSLSKRYLVLGLLYGAIVEGGFGQIPIQLNRISILHHVRAFLSPIADEGGTATAELIPPALSISFLLAFTLLYLALGIVFFGSRQFAGEGIQEA